MILSIEQIRPELTWRLRQAVLYPDSKLYEMELDEDQDGIHFGAFTDNQLVGIISLFQIDKSFQFRKLGVLPEYQKKVSVMLCCNGLKNLLSRKAVQ